ncbi:thiol-disulfide oxidoreductase DCC family protein [Flavobacterium sp. GT3R68]|uniref:thiol-disulfide oxidoreductase DCC family protein n=1 Tax=Flavobacterium sp. GT3R68 TaxID=2594437 RepID=UPI000F899EC2|nr:thiol-disulfide oxidoreductase DCC family protein [Flavobacterium sp. GT3R68]RTY93627.1 thiol-disulfide oxidoreductase DCC family protein [Flavobacterium sp. GSN2]TRW91652.1 thiol-disulfide oxidoreductase DCC family protein [Flavobacterium sp. GT3R68]
MEVLPKDKKIILFDGVCNLCNSMVQFVIKNDQKDIFRYVALQSDLGQEILKHIGIDQRNIDSIVLYQPGIAYYYKSTAAIEIARQLGGAFNLLTLFRVIPVFLRNPIYDYIARNRYKWYGKKDNCIIPTPELQSKFL